MISNESQRYLQSLRTAVQRHIEHGDSDVNISDLIRGFRQSLDLSPTHFARRLQVSPQTVNRWENGTIKPRLRQLAKFEEVARSEEQDPPSAGTDGMGWKETSDREAVTQLGIRLSSYIMEMEIHAKAVCVCKNGRLRESDRGYIGEMVLKALQNGVEFKYIFFENTEADKSFRALLKWVKAEKFTGAITGYCIKSHRTAYELGLSHIPSAWVAIEYGQEQAFRLKRRFDVFVVLAVREYIDSSRLEAKNEDGQPCWVELATPRAGKYIDSVSRLRSLAKSDSDVEVINLTHE
ncbi:MAG: helix-turn-helix protein [Abditibacteriota bacterium]|nr:helix-turn-helix protein [Abditibacteriota bacterium]